MASTAETNVGGKRRGIFIVFEGIDRSGKSTQSSLLFARLKEQKVFVEHRRFPDRSTSIGKCINDYLCGNIKCQNEVIHLLFSANRWESNEEINKSLDNGAIVIADRYAFSGVAYSCGALGLDAEWCKNPDKGLLCPDVVFFLKIQPTEARARSNYGAEVYEKENIQTEVNDAYDIFKNEKFWFSLDATKSEKELHEIIYRKTISLIEEKSYGTKKLLFVD